MTHASNLAGRAGRAFEVNQLRTTFLALVGVLSLMGAVPTSADAPPEVTLILKDHKFTPSTFTVPAGQKVRIVLINKDAATDEFDSHDLKVEEVVTPMATIRFSIGPLKPGEYSFMGEFHPATAQGKLTAVAGPR
jgi:hypothetical protein